MPFETTADLPEPDNLLGQHRAAEALQFGIGIQSKGYNMYALGPAGVGKHLVVKRCLEKVAPGRATPPDWLYVNNFAESNRPRAIKLPAGRGMPLKRDLEKLVEELRVAIPAAFESEEYRSKLEALEKALVARRDRGFTELVTSAAARGVVLSHTPVGFAIAPMVDGKELDSEDFRKLPEDQRETLLDSMKQIHEDMETFLKELPRWEREHREQVKKLRRAVAMTAVGHLIDELRDRWKDEKVVLEHLLALHEDVLENVDEFLSSQEGDTGAAVRRLLADGPSFHRYAANVLVDNTGGKGAPIVYEDRPTVPNLVGRIEHYSRFGALLTDFTLIKAGALHRANGGYLIIDALAILRQPYAWEELKRALRAREIHIGSLSDILGYGSTVALQPEPIPLELKVVVVGDRRLYYLLAEYDPDFVELFKIGADFDEHIDRTPVNALLYAKIIGSIVRQEKLRALDRGAVARVIEHTARLSGDAEKMSTRMQELADLLRETSHLADGGDGAPTTAADVERAIEAQERRSGRIRERILSEIARGTLLIDTRGERVGQINGLSVHLLVRTAFGRPSRITARVRPGKGEVVDIEREVELGGPLHSKGTMIITGLLGQRYAPAGPFALSASLVFEQSYGGVEGDSASLAELLALVSALAEVPLRQWIAVTGSVNQHGEVQPIGGANEKIEGFFDACLATGGLTGTQGVVLPASNVKHLMLRRDVVAAVREGRFAVWPVATLDEAIELLTGVPAGVRDAAGEFPPDSVNGKVTARLRAFAEIARAASQPPEGDKARKDDAKVKSEPGGPPI